MIKDKEEFIVKNKNISKKILLSGIIAGSFLVIANNANAASLALDAKVDPTPASLTFANPPSPLNFLNGAINQTAKATVSATGVDSSKNYQISLTYPFASFPGGAGVTGQGIGLTGPDGGNDHVILVKMGFPVTITSATSTDCFTGGIPSHITFTNVAGATGVCKFNISGTNLAKLETAGQNITYIYTSAQFVGPKVLGKYSANVTYTLSKV